MLDRLQLLEDKYEELSTEMMMGKVIDDPPALKRYGKRLAEMKPMVMCFREYKQVTQELADVQAMTEESLDTKMEEMVAAEITALAKQQKILQEQLYTMMLPKHSYDDKNVVIEIRSGEGGEEAALFAADLYRMYKRYAEKRGWATELVIVNSTDMGGFKEVVFLVEGKGAYSRLKFEGGVHRVQRVPATEAGGRRHNSVATVAVLPEADAVEVEIDKKDLKIDVFCSSGPGGQSVNTTQSAVRVTHLPTGLVATCQDEKSQQINREKAIKVLRTRLMEQYQQEQHREIALQRNKMVGGGERSEHDRTYNYMRNCISDQKMELKLYKLDQIMNGDLDELIDALTAADQTRRLKMME